LTPETYASFDANTKKCTAYFSESSELTTSKSTNLVAGRMFLRNFYVLFDHEGMTISVAESSLEQPSTPFMSDTTRGCVIGLGIAGIIIAVAAIFALLPTLKPVE
jgi:hypothetical protein